MVHHALTFSHLTRDVEEPIPNSVETAPHFVGIAPDLGHSLLAAAPKRVQARPMQVSIAPTAELHGAREMREEKLLIASRIGASVKAERW